MAGKLCLRASVEWDRIDSSPCKRKNNSRDRNPQTAGEQEIGKGRKENRVSVACFEIGASGGKGEGSQRNEREPSRIEERTKNKSDGRVWENIGRSLLSNREIGLRTECICCTIVKKTGVGRQAQGSGFDSCTKGGIAEETFTSEML